MESVRKDVDVTPAGLAAILCGGLALAYPVYLGMMFQSHAWILAASGRPSVTDFQVFWLAGKFALHGAAAAAYDPHLLHAAEAAAAGHGFSGEMPWRYAPHFLFFVAPLAWLPYVAAFITWVAGSTAVYAFVAWRVASNRIAAVIVCGTPAVFINAICGQNGPLTAALIGAALLTLEEQPVACGIFLALLSYKPQFGILFPLVLVAGGYWRALMSAVISTAGIIVASALVFGPGSLWAFVHFLPITSNELLIHGVNGFAKLQTVYGLFRWLGFSNLEAWLAHGTLLITVASGLLFLWRADFSFGIKAAGLAVGTLLATPHLYAYDFAVLMMAFTFLYSEQDFDTVELLGVGAANVCIGANLFVPSPIGLAAGAIGVAIIGRRCVRTLRSAAPVGVQALSPA